MGIPGHTQRGIQYSGRLKTCYSLLAKKRLAVESLPCLVPERVNMDLMEKKLRGWVKWIFLE